MSTNLTSTASALLARIAGVAAVLAIASPSTASNPAAAAPQDAAPGAPAKDAWPESWFWRLGSAGPAHIAMTGKPAPALSVRDWRGGDATLAKRIAGGANALEALKGEIVVVDFWATWCPPCRKALPENVELVRDLASQGVVVLGIHDSARGFETMDDVAKNAGINYPLAIDDAGKSVAAWKVGFWPTYGVVDRAGTLRALGLQPQHVRAVVESLLRESPAKTLNANTAPAAPAGEAKPAAAPGGEAKSGASRSGGLVPAGVVGDTKPSGGSQPAPSSRKFAALPASALEGNPARRAALAKFDGAPEAPSLEVTGWLNADDLPKDAAPAALGAPTLASLKGKIVVLDFWATWCGPCLASVPKMNAFAEKYRDKGVVLIGVCHMQGGEKMADTAKARGISYPLCLDAKGLTNAAYVVDSYPDYYLIDREGRVRGADIGNGSLESAVDRLLAEQ